MEHESEEEVQEGFPSCTSSSFTWKSPALIMQFLADGPNAYLFPITHKNFDLSQFDPHLSLPPPSVQKYS